MKTERSNPVADRREFLRTGTRYVLLTALGAVSVTLLKRGGDGHLGQTCINQAVCSSCAAFVDCGLPQALSAKAAKREDAS